MCIWVFLFYYSVGLKSGSQPDRNSSPERYVAVQEVMGSIHNLIKNYQIDPDPYICLVLGINNASTG